jgi:cation diffusion facilitator CzcD-associated flavoprotein CzcO
MTEPNVKQTTPHVRVAVLGTGFAGLGMAAQLARHGIDDFLVIERANDVGGTWRDNTYPGAACDIRSDLYSFSFALNPDWAYRYGRQPEILDYLRGVVDRFDLRSRIRFGTELIRADWDDVAGLWRITTSTGDLTASVLVSGAGPLIEPKWPAIEGLETFAGPKFHSARWRHDVDLAGKDVAVIGTGASAIQFVPELQKIAKSVTVFQRTAPWIVPRGDKASSARRKRLFARAPMLQRLVRTVVFNQSEGRFLGFRVRRIGKVFEAFSRGYLERQVADPVLRAKLTPSFRIGCKRILISSSYYQALSRPNVELVTDRIESIDATGLNTADGTHRDVDVIISGTGFDATHPPVARLIHGRGGASLADRWSPHMSALRGTTMQDFPNLFFLVGPNTALGHNSIVYMIEAQVEYVLQALQVMDRSRARTIVPRPEAQARYNDRIQADLEGTVWSVGGCTSFYLDDGGRNTTLWPHRAARFRRTVRRFDPNEYVIA